MLVIEAERTGDSRWPTVGLGTVGHIERIDVPGEDDADYIDGPVPGLIVRLDALRAAWSMDSNGTSVFTLRVGWERSTSCTWSRSGSGDRSRCRASRTRHHAQPTHAAAPLLDCCKGAASSTPDAARTKAGKELPVRALCVVLFAVPATAGAAPSDSGACRQLVQDLTVAASTEGTRGDFVSDVFFGNEPNVLGGTGGPSEQEPGTKQGRVVPSQSPGPQVTDPNTGEVGPGLTFGEFQQGVQAFCNS